MKRIFLFYLLLSGWMASSQKFHLEVSGEDARQTSAIDSAGYLKVHDNARAVTEELSALSGKLQRKGFINNKISDSEKKNDSVFFYRFNLGKKIVSIHINVKKIPDLAMMPEWPIKNDSVILPYGDVENFLGSALSRMEKKGFALAKLRLVNIGQTENYLTADLEFSSGKQRQLDDIVINGYPKFPEGHKRNIVRSWRGRTFNQENLGKVYSDFNKFRFVKQVKYPEILFTTDSTKVYVYLEKAKANSFDGYLGFANDDETGKVIFTGYVDLALNNILNTGETFALYWKSDGQEQKTFNAEANLPYIFKSRFGLKAQLNIFKQDSTFQNTKTALDIGYFINYNKRIYIGYQSTESSDIRNLNSASISDFKSAFATATFEWTAYNADDFLFPEKTRLIPKIGVGSRDAKTGNDSQLFGQLEASHNFYLNKKNIVNVRSQDFYLKSNHYIINELYRFGGINSIRGFNENSLQASLLTSILTEYRFVLTPGIYIHSIIDYGYFRDSATSNSDSLLGLGFGIGLLTKTGLFNLVYANGTIGDQQVRLSNSIVHISLKTRF